MINRIKKGFYYFWNLKPSQAKPANIVWLHKWMELFKDRIDASPDELPDGADDLYETAKKIFT